MDWYNKKHYHSRLNFIKPSSRHNGEAEKIVKNRKLVYNIAKKLHPQRFNRGIRNWDLPETVTLNTKDENKLKLNGTW